MRWAQLTLVEDDPGKFDLAFWLDYFRRTRSDAVCLSAGGCVAYYPTQIPFHHRSQWLGDRDVFGELVVGCRKLGMVVIARTDPHATYDDVRQAYPGDGSVNYRGAWYLGFEPGAIADAKNAGTWRKLPSEGLESQREGGRFRLKPEIALFRGNEERVCIPGMDIFCPGTATYGTSPHAAIP